MEQLGLGLMYALATYDDVSTRKINVLEVAAFAIFGIIVNVIDKNHSFISIVGGMMLGVALMIFSLMTKGKIGMGDGLIIMVTGLYLGLMDTMILLWFSSIAAALFGAGYILKNKKSRDVELPFVPFIMGTYLVMYMVEGFREIML